MFTWNAAPPNGTSYEIRAGSSWDSGTVVSSGISGSTADVPYSMAGATVFWARTRSDIGLYSTAAIPTAGNAIFYWLVFSEVHATRSLAVQVNKHITANIRVTANFSAGSHSTSIIANVAVVSSLGKLHGMRRVAVISVVQPSDTVVGSRSRVVANANIQ